jgi:hypothetical protein
MRCCALQSVRGGGRSSPGGGSGVDDGDISVDSLMSGVGNQPGDSLAPNRASPRKSRTPKPSRRT